MKEWIAELRTAVAAVLALALVCCGLYPAAVLVMAQSFFPDQAEGSLVTRDGAVVGSALLSQPFAGPGYFHPRPSAAGRGHDAAASSGSNLGPLSKKLVETVRDRAAQYRAENGLAPGANVPADAVTASASGLDPDISVKNAQMQAARVATARGWSRADMDRLLRGHVRGRTLGLLGEPRINVLELNMALDAEHPNGRTTNE